MVLQKGECSFLLLYKPIKAISLLILFLRRDDNFFLILGLGPVCVVFACSPCDCVGSFWVLPSHPTVQKHACEANWEL